jgi:glycosyltransferase involved in cell wall biosynthesis
LRIAFLITRSDEIGGAHIHVRDMALALKKNKCEVSIIIGGHGIFAELLKNAGIEVHCLKHLVRPIDFSKDFLAFFEIRKVLQYLKPDLLSIHSAKAGNIRKTKCIRNEVAGNFYCSWVVFYRWNSNAATLVVLLS